MRLGVVQRRRGSRLQAGGTLLIRWNASVFRVVIAVAAFVTLAIGSGAGARWN
jgi:hypothetical protein